MTKAQNSKPAFSVFWSLNIRICDLFEIWCLKIGIFCSLKSLQPQMHLKD